MTLPLPDLGLDARGLTGQSSLQFAVYGLLDSVGAVKESPNESITRKQSRESA